MTDTLAALLERFAAEAGPTLKGRNAVRLPMTPAEAEAFRHAQPDKVRTYRVLVCPECDQHDLTRPTTRRKWETYCGAACRARVWRRERRGAVSRPRASQPA